MLAITTSYLLDTQRSLREKSKEIADINRSVFESIRFAELIQTSLLPDISLLKGRLNDASYRVINQIGIGGDTVFIKSIGDGVLFGLLDATGHGIPAAMLSMSGLLMLNELASYMTLNDPKAIVGLLNDQLHNTFNTAQSLAHFEGAVCFYSSGISTLTYCSAKGKAFYVPVSGETTELICTKNSIGENKSSDFENVHLTCAKGDKLLLYSDGLTDQFGGEKDKKYSKLRLKQLLDDNRNKSVSELSNTIETVHNQWKRDTPQTDDVSFMIVEF